MDESSSVSSETEVCTSTGLFFFKKKRNPLCLEMIYFWPGFCFLGSWYWESVIGQKLKRIVAKRLKLTTILSRYCFWSMMICSLLLHVPFDFGWFWAGIFAYLCLNLITLDKRLACKINCLCLNLIVSDNQLVIKVLIECFVIIQNVLWFERFCYLVLYATFNIECVWC